MKFNFYTMELLWLILLSLIVYWIYKTFTWSHEFTSFNKTISDTSINDKDWEFKFFWYHKKKYFHTQKERELAIILEEILDNRFRIYCKVRLIDLFYFNKRSFSAKQKIIQKHIDYIICSNSTYEPLVWIELDDKTHEKASRKKSDEFKDKLFKYWWLPLLRIKTSELYNKSDLKQKISQFLIQSYS